VLESDSNVRPGTADSCRRFVDGRMSDQGLCVGDGETLPQPGTFDKSPFAEGRGFDVLIRKSDMRIVYVTSHGTPNGNDNVTAEALLEEIRAAKAQ
jgi:hypothetical protein